MELLQRVFLLTDEDEASRAVVDHDGVAVIDDVERGRLVIEVDWGQVGFLRVADVNRGLVMSILAGCKFGFQVTPVSRSKRVAVIPCVLRMVILRNSSRCQKKNAENDGKKPSFMHVQPRDRGLKLGVQVAIRDYLAP
jgi:hypothetical protein